MNIAIIGDKATGKATFLVLLYAAQIRYSEISEGDFRFYINPKSINAISAEYNRMQMGDWPSDKLVKEIVKVSFLHGHSKKSSTKGFLNIFKKPKSTPTISLNFSLYDYSDAELSNMINTNTISFMNISTKVELLLASRVIVILIDSSKIQRSKFYNHSMEKKYKNNDLFISNILFNISRYNRKKIHPIFVFTKFDLINKKVLSDIKLLKKPPDKNYLDKRNIYAERIMFKYYPNTLKLVKENRRINYEAGIYFFSSISTTKNSDGTESPALKKSKEVGYILDCSYPEYIGFIEYIEKISEVIENK